MTKGGLLYFIFLYINAKKYFHIVEHLTTNRKGGIK